MLRKPAHNRIGDYVTKKVLMVAFHFPPLSGSSGIQRTLRFVQHLPVFGWQPLVLSVHPRAYEHTSGDLSAEVPLETVVCRAFALDTARHLQVGGRYLSWMARPDRWASWKFEGIRKGLKLINQFKPDAIWSTYPIATAHVIASALHRQTGIPWVADFRDPMAQDDYPVDLLTRNIYRKIEADVLAQANHCVFTTPGAERLYHQRYPSAVRRTTVLENGYDEESFPSPEHAYQGSLPERLSRFANARPMVMLHSGVVYPSERDPTQLFQALGHLRSTGTVNPDRLRIRFRASVHDGLLKSLAAAHKASDFIELRQAIPYRESLAEMVAVDALLIMQARNCNAQIPAKFYEYLRAGKPILGLTDPEGDTSSAMRSAGLTALAPLDSANHIASVLSTFLEDWRKGKELLPTSRAVQQASRRTRSEALAALLDRVTAPMQAG